MTEPRVLILTPRHVPAGVPGAVEVRADCGHQAWISPSGLHAQLAGLINRTQCYECVDVDDVSRFEAVPGAREELSAIMGNAAADHVVDTTYADPKHSLRVAQAEARRRRRRAT